MGKGNKNLSGDGEEGGGGGGGESRVQNSPKAFGELKTDKNHRKSVIYGSIFEGKITKQLKK